MTQQKIIHKKITTKNLKDAYSKFDKDKVYAVSEALDLIKEISFAKFDQSLDVVFKLGVDPKHADQMVRGVVSMPSGTGKTVRVAVICKDEKVEDAISAGADLAGSDSVINDIKQGKINFDICIATPDMMGAIGQVARILGPKGLMPNPKLGTVTPDIKGAVEKSKAGQVEYRAEKAGIIHAGIGKLSFDKAALMDNFNAFTNAIVKAKPSGSKGAYIKGVYVSATMSPAIKVDLATLSL